MTLYDLLTSAGLTLRKSGARYVGQCPGCGGSDDTTRFVTKVGSDTGKCFSCGEGIDSIRYLREHRNMKCREAFAYLGRDCDRSDCPVADKCRGTSPARRNDAASARPAAARRSERTATEARTPEEQWQLAAAKLVADCHQRLLQYQPGLDYLAGRGLDLVAVRKYRLGWLEGERGKPCVFRARTAWGLPEVIDEKTGKPKSLWIPRGYIIPSFVGERIDRIRIRRLSEDLTDPKSPKYIAIEGGGNHVISLNPAAAAQLAVESDLDALLVDHLAGDIVGAIPLTTCAVKPWHYRCEAAEACERAIVILVSLDSDPVTHDEQGRVKCPGGINAADWLRRYPQADRWPVPKGKDPGEAWQQGVDLRAWVLAGLPVSLHPVSPLEPVVVSMEQVPDDNHTEETREMVAALTPAVRNIDIGDGRTAHVTDSKSDYLRLRDEGRIVFTARELAMFCQVDPDPHGGDLILAAKEIFGGALTEVLPRDGSSQCTG